MSFLFLIILFLIFSCSIYFALRHKSYLIYWFLFIVVIQNLILILFSNYISSIYCSLFSIIKEMMLYLSLFFSVYNKKVKFKIKSKMHFTFLSILVVLILKNLFFTSASIISALLFCRFLFLPFVCLYVGKNLLVKKNETKKILKNVLTFSIIIAFSSVIEYYCLGDEFWSTIGYTSYAINVKGNNASSIINGVTINFYTWDFSEKPLRRFVSIIADPLAASFIVFLGANLIFTKCVNLKKKDCIFNYNVIIFLFLFCCSVLFFSKAIFVMMLMTLILVIYFKKIIPKSIMKVIGILGIFIGAAYLYKNVINSNNITSTYNHLMGLVNGFSINNLFGKGLGTAGASVAMLSNAKVEVGESFIGALFYQLGVVGTIAYIGLIMLHLNKLVFSYKKTKNNFCLFSCISLISIFICSIFSESAISLMGTGIYFILIGICEKQYLYIIKSKKYIRRGGN